MVIVRTTSSVLDVLIKTWIIREHWSVALRYQTISWNIAILVLMLGATKTYFEWLLKKIITFQVFNFWKPIWFPLTKKKWTINYILHFIELFLSTYKLIREVLKSHGIFQVYLVSETYCEVTWPHYTIFLILRSIYTGWKKNFMKIHKLSETSWSLKINKS